MLTIDWNRMLILPQYKGGGEGGNKPNGVQKMLNHFIIIPSLAKSHFG